MTNIFDSLEIPISCPHCSHEIIKTVAWIDSHESFDCVGCGATIDLANVHHVSGPGEQPSDLVDEIRRQIARAKQAK